MEWCHPLYVVRRKEDNELCYWTLDIADRSLKHPLIFKDEEAAQYVVDQTTFEPRYVSTEYLTDDDGYDDLPADVDLT